MRAKRVKLMYTKPAQVYNRFVPEWPWSGPLALDWQVIPVLIPAGMMTSCHELTPIEEARFLLYFYFFYCSLQEPT